MNKIEMYRVADAIEKGIKDTTFNMNHVIYKEHPCGTQACIAGHVILMNNLTVDKNIDVVGELLGLEYEQYDELFFAWSATTKFSEINNNKKHVPAVIRWMADNEEINWDKAIASIPEWRKEDE